MPRQGKKPLSGRLVLVTRPREQSATIKRLLEDAGAEVLLAPAITIQPLDDLGPLRQAVQRLDDFDYLLVTSVNAATILLRIARQEKLSPKPHTVVAAVGEETAQALRDAGWTVSLIPEIQQAEGLLELLPEEKVRGRRVLWPHAAKARAVLASGLRDRGAQVAELIIYQTVMPPEAELQPLRQALVEERLAALIFTSGSTVENFVAAVGEEGRRKASRLVIAAIGPVTARACQRYGLPAAVVPRRAAVPDLVQALIDHYQGE